MNNKGGPNVKYQDIEESKRQAFGDAIGLGTKAHVGFIKKKGFSVMDIVTHIIVDGDVTIGRMQRSPGDYLCRKKRASSGKGFVFIGQGNWPSSREPLVSHQDKVNCKECCRILNKLKH